MPSKKSQGKKEDYNNKIIAALRDKPLMLSELAIALGYKSISKKLSQAVEELILLGKLERITDNKQIKIKVVD